MSSFREISRETQIRAACDSGWLSDGGEQRRAAVSLRPSLARCRPTKTCGSPVVSEAIWPGASLPCAGGGAVGSLLWDPGLAPVWSLRDGPGSLTCGRCGCARLPPVQSRLPGLSAGLGLRQECVMAFVRQRRINIGGQHGIASSLAGQLGTGVPLGPASRSGSRRTSVTATDSGDRGYRSRGIAPPNQASQLDSVSAAVSSIASADGISSPASALRLLAAPDESSETCARRGVSARSVQMRYRCVLPASAGEGLLAQPDAHSAV